MEWNENDVAIAHNIHSHTHTRVQKDERQPNGKYAHKFRIPIRNGQNGWKRKQNDTQTEK